MSDHIRDVTKMVAVEMPSTDDLVSFNLIEESASHPFTGTDAELLTEFVKKPWRYTYRMADLARRLSDEKATLECDMAIERSVGQEQINTLSSEKAALIEECTKQNETITRTTATLAKLERQWKAVESQLAEARGALEATKKVIEGEYERVAVAGAGARSVCEHGQFLFQDCIACYDDALIAALALPAEQGEE